MTEQKKSKEVSRLVSKEEIKINKRAQARHKHLLTLSAFTMADRLSLLHKGLDGSRPTESGAIHWSRACGQRVAFTMAEILLSLTIIGVVAAITLPSLTGNINERTWNTQRKALYARFSQAIALMPSLNGYGTTDTNAAEAFITSGLSKVLKINNICGYGTDGSTLFDCGFASKFTDGGGTKQDLPKQVSNLNAGIITVNTPVSIRNTKAAAFETANGESILTFYNPNCTAENVVVKSTNFPGTVEGEIIKQHVCANFVYDLNGKKGPNTVGKDIGTISVMYSSDSKVVMPMYPKGVATGKKHSEAAAACKAVDEGQYRLPNVEEVLSVYYNRLIYADNGFGIDVGGQGVWTATSTDSTHAYIFGGTIGQKYIYHKNSAVNVFCVQR